MGYYIDVMIGIRTGGVFSGSIDLDDLKKKILEIIKDINNKKYKDDNNEIVYIGFDEWLVEQSLSEELSGNKGSYVVIAGVFNGFENGTIEFAKILSKKLGTEVMIMTWDEQTSEVQHHIFLDGKNLDDVYENPFGQALRRVD